MCENRVSSRHPSLTTKPSVVATIFEEPQPGLSGYLDIEHASINESEERASSGEPLKGTRQSTPEKTPPYISHRKRQENKLYGCDALIDLAEKAEDPKLGYEWEKTTRWRVWGSSAQF